MFEGIQGQVGLRGRAVCGLSSADLLSQALDALQLLPHLHHQVLTTSFALHCQAVCNEGTLYAHSLRVSQALPSCRGHLFVHNMLGVSDDTSGLGAAITAHA